MKIDYNPSHQKKLQHTELAEETHEQDHSGCIDPRGVGGDLI